MAFYTNGAGREHPWDCISKDICGQLPASWAEVTSIASAIKMNEVASIASAIQMKGVVLPHSLQVYVISP